ncbi:MAG: sigma-70 family RNA polymerase sigma factor [Gemmatimonadota bacterium]
MNEPDPETLGDLLRRMAVGDERAFAAFYDATSSAVFGTLVRLLADRTQAEEVAQEVYLQAWRRAPAFDPDRGSAWSWIAVLARSRAMDRGRAERSYARAVDRVAGHPVEAPVGSAPTPADEGVELTERRIRVREALATLPPEQRTVIEEAFLNGRSHREIADADGIPLGTVKSRIRTALLKLEAHLRPALAEEGGRS